MGTFSACIMIALSCSLEDKSSLYLFEDLLPNLGKFLITGTICMINVELVIRASKYGNDSQLTQTIFLLASNIIATVVYFAMNNL